MRKVNFKEAMRNLVSRTCLLGIRKKYCRQLKVRIENLKMKLRITVESMVGGTNLQS